MKSRILYVDDDPANLFVFEAACAADFEILTAIGADQALEVMRRVEMAVLLTDQRMPGTSGVELAAVARELCPDTIRMLVTGYADLDSAIDAINLGQVHRYLRKPWDIRELRATLKEACELYAMNREMADLRRRLTETERVYAIGVVAESIGRELTRPIGHVKEALAEARQCVATAKGALDKSDLVRKNVGADIEAADGHLASAETFTDQLLELLRGIDLPLRERVSGHERVALGDVIRLTLQVLRGEFRTRAQIKLDVRPVPPVWGSATGLGQVVLNLLVNALQSFPPSSSPATGRSVADNLVTVRMFARDALVCIEVEDNGVPIPPESLAPLLEPATKRSLQGGNRLGLAISKRIVEELGGKIEAEHPEGGGTRLRLLVPAAV